MGKYRSETCSTCEYFDGGGENAVRRAIEGGKSLHGDCLNSGSPRFQTSSDSGACDVYCSESEEWIEGSDDPDKGQDGYWRHIDEQRTR
jgi:hypothetical protein